MLYLGSKEERATHTNPVEGPGQELASNKEATMEISEAQIKAEQAQKINREEQNKAEVGSGVSCGKARWTIF